MERFNTKPETFTLDYRKAMEEKADRWVAACGGKEVPCIHGGIEYLYVYNHATNEHGYLNLSNDIVQSEAPWIRS